MTKSQGKFLVAVFLLLAIWRVFQIPGVATAFWAFCTVGAIPGTDKVLGFETLIRGLIGLFTVTVLIVFRKEFMEALPRRWPAAPVERPLAAVVVRPQVQQAVPLQENNIVVVLSSQADRPGLAAFRPLLIAMGVSIVWVIHSLCEGETAFRHFVVRSARQLGRGLAIAGAYLRTAAVTLYQLVYTVVVIVIRLLVRLWKYCEPYVRTFDRYIETTLRSNKRAAKALNLLGEASKATREVYQDARHTPRKLS
jgi:hypothetical protein